jgi:putative membrane protein
LRTKLVLVIGLIAYHIACRYLVQRVRNAAPLPSSRALRLFNEGALLLVVPILIMAIVKPKL